MIDVKVLASGSSGNCYHISDGKTRLLLDAGIPYREIQKRLGFTTGGVGGCLITHIHGDHSKAVPDLIKRAIRVYGNKETNEAFPRVTPLMPFIKIGIGTFDVTPVTLAHDAENYGYIIQSLVTGESLIYMTDTAEIPYKFPQIDYALIEANHSESILLDRVAAGEIAPALARRIRETHQSIEQLLDWLEMQESQGASAIKQLFLIHLSDDNSNADEFKKAAEKITKAKVIIC